MIKGAGAESASGGQIPLRGDHDVNDLVELVELSIARYREDGLIKPSETTVPVHPPTFSRPWDPFEIERVKGLLRPSSRQKINLTIPP